MGGLIAQLMAKRHPQEVSGAILAATASELRESLLLQVVWSGMGAFQWWLRLAPRWTWQLAVNAVVQGDEATTEWAVGELRRGAAEDIAEAGRDIGRFDSRAWLEDVRQPMVVLVTTMDLLVPSSRQYELARRLEAPMVRVESDHLAPATTPRRFHRGRARRSSCSRACATASESSCILSAKRGDNRCSRRSWWAPTGRRPPRRRSEEASELAAAVGACRSTSCEP